ncbi:unnamed protein product [Calypogeia fissa]
MGSREKDKDKGVNVQVLLRCRPPNEEEVRTNAPQVISCHDHRREVTVFQNIASKQIDRTFTFDKVFGPQSQQKDLYDQAVVPIVHEVLDGFNCTIFAYGQTGTGKTYTMEGSGRKTKNGGLSADAGVIPRSVQQIFDTLESQNAEYSVKVTFLELYNEEITDLLAPEEFSKVIDDKIKKPLALMEDGKGGVLVRGLEEEIVTSASEIYNLLDRGSAKRRTAETLLNKQSSRSHSIFSITIHIKEATPEGEELIKCGKLNLVDLAGSENISRSGAREGRAREAGEINKSLLTLGRVITALVEHLAHIPYRDSKLTRLLRDSLGGKTKTCIIATVSPSVHCLEETLSTLDYAHRAKNIRNKPEVNQKMMKSALIKDLYGEIERLKVEVYSAREKNGIYLPRDRFFQDEADRKMMAERIEVMEFEIEAKDKHIEELQECCEVQRQQHADLKAKLESTETALEQCQEALSGAKEEIKHANQTIQEHAYVISAQQQAEKGLAGQAAEIRLELERTANDVSELFAKLERKSTLESGNSQVVQKFRKLLANQMQVMHSTMSGSVTAQRDLLKNMDHNLESFLAAKDEWVDQLKKKLEGLRSTYLAQTESLCGVVGAHETISSSTLHKLNSTVSAHASALDQLLANHVADAEMVLNELQTTLSDQKRETAVFAQLQSEAARQSLDTVRDTVKDILGSLLTLHTGAIDFAESLEKRSKAHDSSLLQLAESYKEHAENEKRKMLESIADMLTHSMSRNFSLVQSRVGELRQTSMSEAAMTKQGLISFQETASSAQQRIDIFLKSAEADAVETATMLAAKHRQIGELLQTSTEIVSTAEMQWKTTQGSLQEFERSHIPEMVSIVTEGLETNKSLVAQCETLNTDIVSSVGAQTSETLQLIDDAQQEEVSTAFGLQSNVATQSHVAAQLETSHSSNLDDLRQITEQNFVVEYKEDEPTGLTPTKRAVNIPTLEAIELLRTPALELLQLEFRSKCGQPELEGNLKQFPAKVNGSIDLTDCGMAVERKIFGHGLEEVSRDACIYDCT